jgi:CDP-diacylglycerol--serine O-phosphatidyltransferase
MNKKNKSKIAGAGKKAKHAGDKILKTVKRKRLKYIPLFPSLVTIINGLFGFTAIILMSKYNPAIEREFSYHNLELTYPALAGYMVLLAMIADVLDGRLARMSNSTSTFGGQLDSLCDIISFGLAPAFIIVMLTGTQLSGFEKDTPVLHNFLQRLIWISAAAYISCAAIRLARFNVENEKSKSSHFDFSGLPSPAAAGVIVSLVIFQQEALPEFTTPGSFYYTIFSKLLLWTLPAAGFFLAALMVSRISYPHFLNQYFKGKKPFAYLLMSLVAVGMVIWVRQIALVAGFWGFALSGAIKSFSKNKDETKNKTPAASEEETAGDMESDYK